MSFWKTIAGLISNTEARTLRADAATHTLQTIDHAHHEIHAGSHFYVAGTADINNNDDQT